MTDKIIYAAFPVPAETYDPGMSLRDYFAGQSLMGLRASGTLGSSREHVVKWAYKDADAMIAEGRKST